MGALRGKQSTTAKTERKQNESDPATEQTSVCLFSFISAWFHFVLSVTESGSIKFFKSFYVSRWIPAHDDSRPERVIVLKMITASPTAKFWRMKSAFCRLNHVHSFQPVSCCVQLWTWCFCRMNNNTCFKSIRVRKAWWKVSQDAVDWNHSSLLSFFFSASQQSIIIVSWWCN